MVYEKRRGEIMLSKLEIELKKNSDSFINYNNSSLFHGALMEIIDDGYADLLHGGNVRPYSQYVEADNEKCIWHIYTYTKQAYENIIVPLMNESVNSIELKKKDLKLEIISKKIENCTMDSFMKKYYLTDSERIISISFNTPTSFKSNGRYMIYPTIKYIYESLVRKFDENSNEATIYDEETMEQLINNSEIIGYNMKNTVFHIEGVKIPSFIGKLRIKVNGPQAMVNLINMLVRFGEYSGVGIKCSLGMGNITVTDNYERKTRKE